VLANDFSDVILRHPQLQDGLLFRFDGGYRHVLGLVYEETGDLFHHVLQVSP